MNRKLVVLPMHRLSNSSMQIYHSELEGMVVDALHRLGLIMQRYQKLVVVTIPLTGLVYPEVPEVGSSFHSSSRLGLFMQNTRVNFES